MSDFDLLVRSQNLKGTPLCLGISEGIIQAVAPELLGTAKEELDHRSGRLIPGWVDSHVHFNEPGRTDWEGISSGSRALAAGGGTAFFDMPLNSSPPVLDFESFQRKRECAEARSCLDFALWGGLTASSVDSMEALAGAGAIGFKAFMCPSGLDEFPHADASTLKAGMIRAAALQLPVAVHAELEPGKKEPRQAKGTMEDWLSSRPIAMELDAIAIALELAGETQCPLHIVHVSNPEGIALISQAKQSGVNVTVETCPHYLLLDDHDAICIGAPAKCAPPLRPRETLTGLRDQLQQLAIDTIGSDHSPASPDLKDGNDMFAIWGGIAGIQHGLLLLIDEELASPSQWSHNVARRFSLSSKGGLEPGKDADFVLLEATDPQKIESKDLFTRHPISPYLGRTIRKKVAATYLRGCRVTRETRGRFLRPDEPDRNGKHCTR